MPPRPCLDCQQLTHDTRCPDCAKRRNRIWRGEYLKQAKQVREQATVCWICGEGARPDDPFTADHLLPANPNSPLLPAHRTCNSRRGNRT